MQDGALPQISSQKYVSSASTFVICGLLDPQTLIYVTFVAFETSDSNCDICFLDSSVALINPSLFCGPTLYLEAPVTNFTIRSTAGVCEGKFNKVFSVHWHIVLYHPRSS
ncbi:hypothetical protein AVEN_27254-1 [Araneus ventricosus]|uniref:Uncharacterized protein n=1 Tax=Araneus ventricosus TaxID=182803 RepID=A0A4Y2CBP9_ARAVE|nr:hypothetical protein AVEN_27254-1 [Araneus ventricosus]